MEVILVPGPLSDNGDHDWEVADDTPPESKYIGLPNKPMPDTPALVEITKINEGATDAADNPVPECEVRVLADWVNHRDGEPQPVAAGEAKTWTMSQAILKDRIEQLKPKEGDQLKITFDRMAGRAKHFTVAIRRRPSITYAELEA